MLSQILFILISNKMKERYKFDKQEGTSNEVFKEPTGRPNPSKQQQEESLKQQHIQEYDIRFRNKENKDQRGKISIVEDNNGHLMIKVEKRLKAENQTRYVFFSQIKISDITDLRIDDRKITIYTKDSKQSLIIYFGSNEIAKKWRQYVKKETGLLQIKRNKSTKTQNLVQSASEREHNMKQSLSSNSIDKCDQSSVVSQKQIRQAKNDKKQLVDLSLNKQLKSNKQGKEMINVKIDTVKEFYSDLYENQKLSVESLTKQIEWLKGQVDRYKRESQQLKQRLNAFKQEQQIFEKNIEALNITLQTEKTNNVEANKQLTSLTTQYEKNTKKMEKQLQRITKQWETKYDKMETQFKTVKVSQEKLKTQIQTLLKEQKRLSTSNSLFKKQLEEIQYNYIFDGDVIGSYNAYKKFLRESIERFTSNTIIKTRIIYKFDKLNTVNFHEYIDNHSHIMIIVRTKAGALLAAFTEGAFRRNQPSNQRGLLFSLTNMKIFEHIQGKRAITYDDFYIIFGNSEFRIRSQEKKIYSNFGIGNGFYNSNNHKVDILLQEGNNREVDIEDYEVHEILYK